jgi:tetratricopeptide (TPR) repeat protein
MVKNLEVSLRDKLDSLFREAITKTKTGENAEAIRLAELAWSQYPEPKLDWDVSWSYTRAMARVYRDTGNFQKALDVLYPLYNSNEMIHKDGPAFYLGTVYFEMEDMVNAKKWLSEANTLSRGRCFRDEDKKYKAVITKK